jgi:hypothetical protein
MWTVSEPDPLLRDAGQILRSQGTQEQRRESLSCLFCAASDEIGSSSSKIGWQSLLLYRGWYDFWSSGTLHA